MPDQTTIETRLQQPTEAVQLQADAERPQAAPFTRVGVWRGIRQGLPLAVGSCAGGLVFGALAHTAGLRLAETALMSTTVVAGSAQFVVIGLWTTPPVLASVLTATLLVNLRHLLLGATLRPWFARSSRLQTYGSAFFLFDETWALTYHEAESGAPDRAFLLGCGLALWLAWVVGTVIGGIASGWVPDPTRWGLDFAGTAVFSALLAGMWRGKRDILPWLVAAAVALGAAHWLPGQWYIVLGGLSGSIVGAWRNAE